MYDREIEPGQTVTFGVSGMLYRNGLIMYDRQTDSLWSHILGQAISGDFKGTQLEFLPALQTDWETWKARHPETLVVDPELFSGDVYDSYYASSRAGVLGRTNADDTLLTKEYVIGVRLGPEARAYPFSVLNQQPVINDEVAGEAIVVFFDEASASGAVFDRRLADGTLLSFEPAPDDPQRAIDTGTGSHWDIFTGQSVSGPLEGTQLTQVPITYAFWFGWADYHGEGTVYTPNGG